MPPSTNLYHLIFKLKRGACDSKQSCYENLHAIKELIINKVQ